MTTATSSYWLGELLQIEQALNEGKRGTLTALKAAQRKAYRAYTKALAVERAA